MTKIKFSNCTVAGECWELLHGSEGVSRRCLKKYLNTATSIQERPCNELENPSLYSFRRCPYAMRGRMGLHAAGINYEHREVLLRDKPAAMIAASPKGTVPVFIKTDGYVIDESLELLLWASEQHDPLGWRDVDMGAAMALITRNDEIFKFHLDRYKYKSRYDESAKRGETDIKHRRAAEAIIADYETRLSQQDYMLGPRQSLADIAIFPFMRQFANTDRAWWDGAENSNNQDNPNNQDNSKSHPPYPNTHNWLERHINSPLFQAIMTKYAQWQGEIG